MTNGLNDRLPLIFTEPERPAADAVLVVFSGLPGVGKSTIADEVGRTTGTPVASFDWLLGALSPFGGRAMADLMAVGDELVTTVAYRQLRLGQSAIIDAPAESPTTRERWRSMAAAFSARFKVVLCECNDDVEHRRRLEGRVRGIAGWHEGGNWANVAARKAAFPRWDNPIDELLVLDLTNDADANVQAVLSFVGAEVPDC